MGVWSAAGGNSYANYLTNYGCGVKCPMPADRETLAGYTGLPIPSTTASHRDGSASYWKMSWWQNFQGTCAEGYIPAPATAGMFRGECLGDWPDADGYIKEW